jgi:serine/threonine-protein kinase
VYSLGAILFELLAWAPLHRCATSTEAVASTLATDGARPSERAPTHPISPELDALCERATRLDPAKRFESARAMQEAIERYLDGERDKEQRRQIARRHADAARAAFEAATRAGANGEPERARGLRELGAALALEPSNEEAMRTLMRVLLEAPAELPPEAEAELAEVNRLDRVRGARDGAMVYSLMGVSVPILLTMHVKQPLLLGAVVAATLATQGYFAWMWRTGKATRRYMRFAVPMSFVLVALTTTAFGPFVIAPGTAIVTLAAFMVNLRADVSVRRQMLLPALASILVPAALPFLGIGPMSYVVEGGSIQIVSNLVEFRPVPALLLLALGSALTVIATALSVGRAVDALVASERRNFAQAYRLRQLLPRAPSVSAAPGA